VKATVNGIELYYEIHGRGDWLVLAHEFSGAYTSWQPQVDALQGEHRILIYNNRGYPPSTVPTEPSAYSQEHSIEDLRQLLAHVGVERPVLVGFSMGGSLVLNFALAYPDRVRGLVLAGTGTGSIDKAQNARDFGPIADRFLSEGPANVGEEYLGEEDAPALEPSRFLARTIANARLTVLPKTGHTLQLEEPDAFNAAVLEFIRRLRS